VDGLLDARLAVPLYELSRVTAVGSALGRGAARRLIEELRVQGYLLRAHALAAECETAGLFDDSALTKRIESQLRFFAGDVPGDLLPPHELEPRRGRVMHVVGGSLRATSSSYSRRTHDLASRARELGVDAAVATQMGTVTTDGYSVDSIAGVPYHRIPGPSRGSIPLDEWLRLFVTRLAAVVRKARPAALVPASDFVNGVAALAVGRAYGIPVVYDIRGMWEDAWLERQREQLGWSGDQVPVRWGYPDVWTLRRRREEELLRDSSAVIAASPALVQTACAAGAAPDRVALVEDVPTDAMRYVRLLEDVGALDPGAAAIAVLPDQRMRGTHIRERMSACARMPLERTSTTGVAGSATDIRTRGWRLGSLDPVHLELPFDWVDACRDNRSQAFHLHAWDFMVPALREWDTSNDEGALRWCLDRAVSWCETFNEGDDRGTMAWYDMALALRAPRLAYLLAEALTVDVDDSILDVLATAVSRHQQELFASRAYNPRTNHGFYTAVGEVSFARRLVSLPAMDVLLAQGRSRLADIVARQFAPDGGHLEHSPDYHRMLLESFLDAVDDGLVDDPAVLERLRRAEVVMGWLIQPGGTIVQIGDSPATVVDPRARVVQEPRTAFIASQGARGVPFEDEMLFLPDTGYAIVRSPQPKGTNDHLAAGYLTFMGAFHSRAHKHCDDLSLTWFDRGVELLIDPGRFGYLDQLPADAPQREQGFYYGRPERQYVERTMAHNTVQSDGQDHRRRGRVPYGSALVSADQRDGCFRIVGAVDHEWWRHVRTVTYLPGRWMLVEDEVSATDGALHDFEVWWNLSGDLVDPVVSGSRVSMRLPDGGPHLVLTSLDGGTVVPPVRGGKEPLRGWRSTTDYSFTEAWSTGFRVERTGHHVLRTLLAFDPDRVSVPTHPFSDG